MILRKRIMGVALEIEMSTFIENEYKNGTFPVGALAPNLMPSKIQGSNYHFALCKLRSEFLLLR